MPRCANSRLRSPSGSPPCPHGRSAPPDRRAPPRCEEAIARRGAAPEVDRRARALAADLLAAYPVPLAPAAPPDLGARPACIAQHCASCHGADGAARRGRGELDPPPIDFTDRTRARERSLFALYQVIGQGLEGTAMQSFAHLPPEDRWALALRSGQFAYPPALAEEGRGSGKATPRCARESPTSRPWSLTPAALARRSASRAPRR